MLYWETWENEGVHTVHWGEIGTKGESKTVKSTFFKKAETKIQAEMNDLVKQGYREIQQKITLIIEYSVEGMGSENDLKKRHRLEDRMNETLGWAGLGHCDGGSMGNHTMEVCCLVVDFETAKTVIEKELHQTEFQNYTRIYDANAHPEPSPQDKVSYDRDFLSQSSLLIRKGCLPLASGDRGIFYGVYGSESFKDLIEFGKFTQTISSITQSWYDFGDLESALEFYYPDEGGPWTIHSQSKIDGNFHQWLKSIGTSSDLISDLPNFDGTFHYYGDRDEFGITGLGKDGLYYDIFVSDR